MSGTSPHLTSRTSARVARSPRLALALALSCTAPLRAVVTDEQFALLVEENRALRSMLVAQQAQLDELRQRLDAGSGPAAPRAAEAAQAPRPPVPEPDRNDSHLRFSGEASVVWLDGQRDGAYPNSEFRVDDAFLRLDAQVTPGLYFFGELELSKHTAYDDTFHLGEAYIEFENLVRPWNADRLINVRVGRMDIPYGEEYQRRDPLANPLITNSLSDIWGIDEGILVFGEAGRASYAFAVQNGSSQYLRDFDADKSLTLRLGYDPTRNLHFSASAHRTGDLNAAREPASEIWLGGGFFRPIGSAATTTFQAQLAGIDASYTSRHGRMSAAWGLGRYRDNDPLADNHRDFRYHQLEATLDLSRRFWVAARYSGLHAQDGYPIPGLGAFARYFYGAWPAEDLWRLSLGGGYRFAGNALVKVDYTVERGELLNGSPIEDRDQIAAQIGVGF